MLRYKTGGGSNVTSHDCAAAAAAAVVGLRAMTTCNRIQICEVREEHNVANLLA